MNVLAKLALSLGMVLTALSSTSSAAVLYQHNFGGVGGPLNGALVDSGAFQTGAVAWSASAAFLDDGSIDQTQEGGALLPFEPIPNAVYTLSMDLLNQTDRWVAIGFARDPLTLPGGDTLNDRHANEIEGIAWMLYRNNNAANAIESFAGLRTAGGQALDSAGVDFNTGTELKIVIDTTGDGSSFNAEWFVDGVSKRSATVGVAIDDINFVGISYDDAGNGNIALRNFTLTGPIPEPASFALLGAALLGVAGRRRR